MDFLEKSNAENLQDFVEIAVEPESQLRLKSEWRIPGDVVLNVVRRRGIPRGFGG